MKDEQIQLQSIKQLTIFKQQYSTKKKMSNSGCNLNNNNKIHSHPNKTPINLTFVKHETTKQLIKWLKLYFYTILYTLYYTIYSILCQLEI